MFEEIRAIVAKQLRVDVNKITEETSIKELGADSLDLVEIVMSLEDKYGISIPDEAAPKLKTIGDAIKYIEEKTK